MSRISFNARLILGAAAAACVALGGAASAQAQDGDWYIGGSMPLMFIDDSDTISTGSTTSQQQGRSQPVTTPHRATVRAEHDTGFKLGGVVGYHLGSGLRLEGEIFMARAEISKLTNTNISVEGQSIPLEVPVDVSGSAQQLGAMVNLWYDFEMGSNWTPYVGGGVGLIRIDQGGISYDNNRLAQEIANFNGRAAGHPSRAGLPPQLIPMGSRPRSSATDTAFAYQIRRGNRLCAVGQRRRSRSDTACRWSTAWSSRRHLTRHADGELEHRPAHRTSSRLASGIGSERACDQPLTRRCQARAAAFKRRLRGEAPFPR